MAFTVEDFEDMLRILERNPEWQERMRRAILSRELLELPERLLSLIQQLIESDARNSAQIAELTRTVQRHDEAIATLIQTVQRHNEILLRHDELIAELIQTVQRHDALIAELIQTVQRHDALIAELIQTVQRQGEQIAELTRAVQRALIAVQRHDALIAELIQTVQRHDEQIAELVQVVRELAEAQRRAEARLERLENRLEGEIGRQSGERYEREVVASAPVFFYGGQGGGLGNPMVQDQLRQWLQPLFEQGVEISHLANPFRADIIWWKGDRVMVVEVGIKVSRDDVKRAAARAELLRRAGVNATPAVIGEEWGLPDVQALAQQEGVEWFVGDGLSQGFLEFRKLPDGLPPR
jgi:phage shock protein A